MWLYNVGPQWAKRLTLTGDTITGAEAAAIGLVLKAVPADLLAAEVEGLADHRSRAGGGPHAPAARGRERRAPHLAESARAFRTTAREQGLEAALREREEKFAERMRRWSVRC